MGHRLRILIATGLACCALAQRATAQEANNAQRIDRTRQGIQRDTQGQVDDALPLSAAGAGRLRRLRHLQLPELRRWQSQQHGLNQFELVGYGRVNPGRGERVLRPRPGRIPRLQPRRRPERTAEPDRRRRGRGVVPLRLGRPVPVAEEGPPAGRRRGEGRPAVRRLGHRPDAGPVRRRHRRVVPVQAGRARPARLRHHPADDRLRHLPPRPGHQHPARLLRRPASPRPSVGSTPTATSWPSATTTAGRTPTRTSIPRATATTATTAAGRERADRGPVPVRGRGACTRAGAACRTVTTRRPTCPRQQTGDPIEAFAAKGRDRLPAPATTATARA